MNLLAQPHPFSSFGITGLLPDIRTRLAAAFDVLLPGRYRRETLLRFRDHCLRRKLRSTATKKLQRSLDRAHSLQRIADSVYSDASQRLLANPGMTRAARARIMRSMRLAVHKARVATAHADLQRQSLQQLLPSA